MALSKLWKKVSPIGIRLELPHELKCHPVFKVTALKIHHESSIFNKRYTSLPPPVTDLDLKDTLSTKF